MTTRQVSYTSVADLVPDNHENVHFRLAEAIVDGVQKTVLTASAGSLASQVDVSEVVTQLLEGKASGIYANRDGTKLAAKYTSGLTITVESAAKAALFADLEPLAVSNDGETWYYGQVDGAPAGAVITLQHALGATLYKNAYVVNLAGLALGPGLGFNNQPGILELLERPTEVNISVADGTGDTIDVTVTPNNEDGALRFDVYVRDAVFTRVDPAWQPDLADQASVASALNVTTFNGGADYVPDGTGGSLTSSKQVWVAVVVKKATGQTDVDESAASNVVEHTLD